MFGYQESLGDCCGEKAIQILMISQTLSVFSPPGSKELQPNTEAAAAPSLTNISHFTQKLVEKLYSGMFSADPRHILLFITEHIMVVRTPGWLWW